MATKARGAEAKKADAKKDGDKGAWETVSEPLAYDPDEFYCRASDKRGHSGQVYVRIPPEVLSLVEQVMESKLFPFRTYGDLMRDGLVHRVNYLRSKVENKEIDAALIRVLAIERIIREEEFDKELSDMVRRLEAIIDERLKDHKYGKLEAAKIVRSVLDNVVAMPEGYRRQRYSSIFEDKYGYLLEKDGTKS
jgi:hypothetical protein